MPNKMLIDATHPEETRVVVVRGNRVEEFDFETAQRKQLRGNIYLAKVTRVEPSLQAAFVEYGGNRHGFLAFSEIHPDYYQIPVADRQALIEAEERAHREAEEESENRSNRRRNRHRSSRRRGSGERVQSEIVEAVDGDQAVHAEGHEADHEAHEHHAYAQDDHTDQPHAEAGEHDETHDEAHGFSEAPLSAPAHDDAADAHQGAAEPSHDHADDHHDAVAAHAPAEPAAAAEQPAVEAAETAAASINDAPAEASAPAAEVAEADDDHETHAHDEHDREHDHHDHDEHDHDDDVAPVGEHEGEGVTIVPGDENGAEPVSDEHEDDDEEIEEEVVESVGGDDVLEEVPERTFRPRRQYKIQEVIKRRQVMLVQVVKEERGNKGAALTTYLSLAGRYAVLMPNTARGGGISRKITSAQDRSRLKEVVQDLDVPEGMGVILRTAGANRTKPEIKRDFEYLLRLWETVRDMTLKSQAPTLVYEEGSLIKRSLRDLYNKEIDEILVAGEAGYREAHDFMKMLMPTNVRAVKQYRDGQPLFSRMGVESQLDAMFSPTVQLRSGGYIVINQTEALVSIDVNSGRATREHHIEDTALKTNMEAAEEVARQLRLRDLAGLIVIDFIDMDEKRNNRSVERKLSDCLRQDRARIQVGRISHFGLLEMSRQRIRASVLESSTEPCAHCGGTGHVRSVSSVALQLLRSLEEALMKGATHNLVVRTRTEVALYVLNHKRGHLRDLENGFKVSLAVIADPSVSGQQSFIIDRGEQVHTLEAAKALLVAQASAPPLVAEEIYDEDEAFDVETESEVETEETEGLSEDATEGSAGEGERDGQRRKRRRRRRGRGSEAREGALPEGTVAAPNAEPGFAGEQAVEESDAEDDESEEQPAFAQGEQTDQPGGERRPRRRGRRGGRRRRGGAEDGLAASIGDELAPASASEVEAAVADFDGNGAPHHEDEPAEHAAPVHAAAVVEVDEPAAATPAAQAPAPAVHETEAPKAEAAKTEAPKAESEKTPRRSTVREKVSFVTEPKPESTATALNVAESNPAAPAAETAPSEPVATEPAATDGTTPAAPRRAGWWSRRFGGGQ
ncbi:putative ribonuclease E [Bradyrhizobium sp. ORS 285]|uniref:Rne/Rng family ribonuclease n=1 Tax=Bradyrhizobium sp. ORS 285 TaxID=115808 RepID=UPI000240628D|nr:ribonuclease E/G [Bradyrhizobium sp. ORS 285]CCD89511.1 putative ribonuclease E [Bradyrhizobium sp. ORS 285]SMX58758.1 putative ribonuclease E [Bradyrhizobium sp. ORS 285]